MVNRLFVESWCNLVRDLVFKDFVKLIFFCFLLDKGFVFSVFIKDLLEFMVFVIRFLESGDIICVFIEMDLVDFLVIVI